MPRLPETDGKDLAQEQQGLLSPFLRQQRYKRVVQHITANDQVLDFGCGSGELKTYLHPETGYYGVDAQASWPQEATYLFASKVEDPLPAALEGKEFTIVTSLAVLEHLKTPDLLLQKAAEVLPVGGKLVITTPHPIGRNIHEFGASIGIFSQDASEEHEKFFDKAALTQLAQNNVFKLTYYRRFLFGMNQIAVFEKL